MSVNRTSDDFIRIQAFWGLFLSHWHWFAFSVLVSLSFAVFYLLRTPEIYTRTASILVKDDSNGTGTAAMTEFSELAIFKSNTNINNELFTLKSPALMAEVVNRLGLNELYLVRKGLQQVELYKSSPVNVLFRNANPQGVSFVIKLVSKTDFVLTGFNGGDGEVAGKIGTPVKTPAGVCIVSATQHFTSDYVGEEILYVKERIASVANAYAGSLAVGLNDENTTIINLSIADASIQKAEDILNNLIDVYNEKWIQDRNQVSVSTSQFISERLGVIENELGHVDENISSFKSAHLMPDVQAASNIYMAQSVENKRLLLDLNAQLTTAQYVRQELNTKPISQLLPVNTGITSNNIAGQIDEYNNKVLNRNRLVANSDETNPMVHDLEKTLNSMKETIIQSVDNLIVSLSTQIRSVQQQQSNTTGQLASNPNQAKYLLSVERQQKVKEELYLYLLQKREENELSQAFTAYNTRVISSPHGSNSPTAPRRGSILMVAFSIGLLVPTVILFLKETLNTKVRGRKDLAALKAPLVGEIPLHAVGKRTWNLKRRTLENQVVVQNGNRNVINEAFRVLRSNIEFMMEKKTRSGVFVVTSFNSGSGKSFLTLNLAIAFAIKGKKVLVIDGDLRHGTLSTYAGSPKNGLSYYLGGKVDNWQDIVCTDGQHDKLDYIPIGTIPPNPTELLEEERLETLIGEVRGRYDYIFIDCPPIDILADTQILEKLADRTLFVVRTGLLDRSMIPELESIYEAKRFKNLSVILNGTAGNASRYKYGNYHRYYRQKD